MWLHSGDLSFILIALLCNLTSIQLRETKGLGLFVNVLIQESLHSPKDLTESPR